MNAQQRARLRIAQAIADGAAAKPRIERRHALPLEGWQALARLARQQERAVGRGWWRSAHRLRRDLRTALQRHRWEIDALERTYRDASSAGRAATARDVFDDLSALETEFAAVHCDPKRCIIAVETEPITLSGIYLGPFQIALDWHVRYDVATDDRDRDGVRRYRVVALDPNHADTDSRVTHPHVSDEGLCEGEAALPIHRALDEGRLYDFFLLVRQVLTTYNSESAYVRLDEWEHVCCHDCGSAVGEAERTVCWRCDTTICHDCEISCPACSETTCGSCCQVCAGCTEYFCEACLQACSECQQSHCEECLTDGRCPSCRQSAAENEDEECKAPATTSSLAAAGDAIVPPHGAAIHPVRLGEAAVPA